MVLGQGSSQAPGGADCPEEAGDAPGLPEGGRGRSSRRAEEGGQEVKLSKLLHYLTLLLNTQSFDTGFT